MGYYQSKQMDSDYSRGENDGRKDGARRWGKRDTSHMPHPYHTGYNDGYHSTYCL